MITHNPDISWLRENLDAIQSQVACVIVFDNGSDNVAELQEALLGRSCLYSLNGSNLGLSKALNICCAVACELSADKVLLLDQDSVAGTDMVRGLEEAFAGNVALVGPQIVDVNQIEAPLELLELKEVKRSITSGSLIDVCAWKAVGGFDEDLFVDWVDYEFSANLRKHGYALIRNQGVLLFHEMGKKEFAFRVPWIGGWHSFYRTNHATTRLVDKACSWAIVANKYGFSKVGIEEMAFMAAIALKDIVLEKDKSRVVGAFVSGICSGVEAIAAKKVAA